MYENAIERSARRSIELSEPEFEETRTWTRYEPVPYVPVPDQITVKQLAMLKSLGGQYVKGMTRKEAYEAIQKLRGVCEICGERGCK